MCCDNNNVVSWRFFFCFLAIAMDIAAGTQSGSVFYENCSVHFFESLGLVGVNF